LDKARWAQLDALFEAALDQPAERRGSWVEEACGSDAELAAELQRLLSLSDEEDDHLKPAGAMTATLWDEIAQELRTPADVPTLEPGDELGHYRIRRLLGRGGMGQVYVAEDERLGREIALKMLPREIASPERRKRFEREAVAIAALSHPNIVHVYSIEELQGVPIMTMERVRGRTLADLIPPAGLPLKQLLDIAVDLAAALAAAHEQGIIHRDLKPANVMVSDDGRVKVLDFGLAKLAAGSTAAPLPNASATSEGQIVGTVSYMSPEQAEGQRVDPRTDIFSFGILLYEMSTGRTPFKGDSAAAVLSSILKDTPPTVSEVNPRLPPDLSRIVKRCLAKDLDRRYQTALDVRNELEDLRYEVDSRKLFQSAAPRRSGLSGGQVGAVFALLVALGAAAGVVTSRWGRDDSRALEGTFAQLTSEPGQEIFPSLSPDGGFLAYASPAAGNWDVYLLRTRGSRAINLTASTPEDDSQPAFSADGERIAFRSGREGGGLFVMGATGESVRRVSPSGWNPTWSPDGTEIAFATAPVFRTPLDRPTRSALWVVDVWTGERREVFPGDAVQPSWSPNGHRIAFWAVSADSARRDLWTVPARGGEPVAVTADEAADWNPVWSSDGRYLFFTSDRSGSMNLWRVPIDERTGRASGTPEPVTAPSPFACHVTLSRDGSRLAYTSAVVRQSIASAAFDPVRGVLTGTPRLVLQDVGGVSAPRISPDGEWLAYYRAGVQEDIVLVRPDGRERRPLTEDPARDRFPEWSPDSRELVFYSNRGGNYEVWTVDRDGTGLRPLTETPGFVRYPSWSPDGARIAFSVPGTSGILFDPSRPWSEQEPKSLPPYGGEEDFVPFDWAPDGRLLAGYALGKDGIRRGIALYDLGSRSYERITESGLFPRWLSDGRRLLFQSEPAQAEQPSDEPRYALGLVDVATREVREVFALPSGSVETPDLSADDRTLFFVQTSVEADLWLLELEP